jgi:hypothetical protein
LIDELEATSFMAAAKPGAVRFSIGRGRAAAPMANSRSAQNLESKIKGTQTEGMPAHRALQSSEWNVDTLGDKADAHHPV